MVNKIMLYYHKNNGTRTKAGEQKDAPTIKFMEEISLPSNHPKFYNACNVSNRIHSAPEVVENGHREDGAGMERDIETWRSSNTSTIQNEVCPTLHGKICSTKPLQSPTRTKKRMKNS